MGLVTELRRRNVFRMAVIYSVAAWLIMQVAEVVIGLANLADWIGPAILGLLAIGFPIALILSWFYELTPAGINLEKDVDTAVSATRVTDRRLDFVIISLLCAAVMLFAYDKWWLPEPPEKSIAVLAFENMSADPEQEYFSDGIAEELLNLLAQIPELHEISRSSAFSFKGKNVKLADIARELNVAHILEGSVRKAGNQIRITVQLIEARSDTHLWSKTYDRKLDNIFQIQDEIAAAVVAALKIELLGAAPHARKTDQEAFKLALQARYFWNRRSPGDEEKTMDYYQRAIDIDPGYAAAWTGLSVTYLAQAVDGRIPLEAGLAKAREAVETALAIDPGLSDAHVRLAQIYERYDDWTAARDEYQQALALDPNNPLAQGAMASFMWRDGYLDEAIDLNRKAADIDPLSAIWPANLSDLLIKAGRLDEAEQATRKAIELSPESPFHQGNLMLISFFQGQFDEALDLTRSFFPEGSPYKAFGLTVTYHAMGRQDESDAAMRRLTNSAERDIAYLIAMAHAERGEPDQAFAWLDKALDERDFGLGEIKFEPFLRNLHDDPRWDDLIDQLKRQRDSIHAVAEDDS